MFILLLGCSVSQTFPCLDLPTCISEKQKITSTTETETLNVYFPRLHC